MRKVLFLYDQPGWAWENASRNLCRWLPDHGWEGSCLPLSEAYTRGLVQALEESDAAVLQGMPLLAYHGMSSIELFSACAHRLYLGITSGQELRSGVGTWLEKRLEPVQDIVRRCAGIFAVCENLRKQGRVYWGRAVWWCPRGVDIDHFRPSGLYEAPPLRCGWAGNPDRVWKRFDDCHAAARDAGYQWTPACKRRFSYEDMPAYYRGLRALICLSADEGTPNVVFEALACGVPVVSTPCGAVPEIESRGYGLYVTDNVEDAREQLRRLSSNDCWAQATREARDAALGWSWERRTADFAEMLAAGL